MSFRPRRQNNNGTSGENVQESLIRGQNEQMLGHLQHNLGQLKQVSIAIREETIKQNKLLEEMDGQFSNTNSFLDSTVGKLAKIISSGGSKHMCYLMLFSFIVFVFIWIMMKRRG